MYLHCITLYYAQQEISWKPRKTSKFQPIHSTIQIWTDFHENEAKKKFFFEEKNSKWPIFQNRHFSKCPSHQSILLTQGPICEILAKKFQELAILKNGHFEKLAILNFFA